MTLYAVYDTQGKMVSNAYSCQEWAWLNFFKYQTEGNLETDQGKLKKAHLDQYRKIGYRIALVGIYNPETQVVVDRALINNFQPRTYEVTFDSGEGDELIDAIRFSEWLWLKREILSAGDKT
jgi:hypothetical protein